MPWASRRPCLAWSGLPGQDSLVRTPWSGLSGQDSLVRVPVGEGPLVRLKLNVRVLLVCSARVTTPLSQFCLPVLICCSRVSVPPAEETSRRLPEQLSAG